MCCVDVASRGNGFLQADGALFCRCTMNLERVTLADDGSGLCAFLLAAYWFAPVSAAAFADQRHGLSQTLAGVDACHGSGADRPRLDTAGAVTVSGATVVTAIDLQKMNWKFEAGFHEHT